MTKSNERKQANSKQNILVYSSGRTKPIMVGMAQEKEQEAERSCFTCTQEVEGDSRKTGKL